MRLSLFQFIEDTVDLFEKRQEEIGEAERHVKVLIRELLSDSRDNIVSVNSRIKRVSSLKEKLIRNRFYLNYDSAEEALANMHDLIGVTIQCRFIRNEPEIYQQLRKYFLPDRDRYSRCIRDENTFLNLRMPQPQLQRNGFTIYRVDGYTKIGGHTVNFELQIKSMVHEFWNAIEHEVVYKNPDFVIYDRFNKDMLGAIRDNLDTVDRQLEIMYNEISSQSRSKQIGMDEKGFKTLVASSINELVNRKMKETVGFTTDFKQCSAILAQFIYVHDFVNGEHNREKMLDYLEHLSFLSEQSLDFREEIFLEPYEKIRNPFNTVMAEFFRSVMNINFEWHVFFMILFVIRQGNPAEEFEEFINTMRILLIQPGWYAATFSELPEETAKEVQEAMETTLAYAMRESGSIRIIHEESLYRCMEIFRNTIQDMEIRYHNPSDLERDLPALRRVLYQEIQHVFD